MIAIGEPYNDALKENQGSVYILTHCKADNLYSPPNSPSGEQNENFETQLTLMAIHYS